METRTKRTIGVIATLLLAVMSLFNRVEKGALPRRLSSAHAGMNRYPSKVPPWRTGSEIPRRLQIPDPRSIVDKTAYPERVASWKGDQPADTSTTSASQGPATMSFQLPQSAEEWCMPPSASRLPYHQCHGSQTVNQLPLVGGLTYVGIENVL